jgi:hypothetical protein
MGRDRDTGPAAAQDRILKKIALTRLKFDGRGREKRPQNSPLAGPEKKILDQLKIIELIWLNF